MQKASQEKKEAHKRRVKDQKWHRRCDYQLRNYLTNGNRNEENTLTFPREIFCLDVVFFSCAINIKSKSHWTLPNGRKVDVNSLLCSLFMLCRIHFQFRFSSPNVVMFATKIKISPVVLLKTMCGAPFPQYIYHSAILLYIV